MTYTHDTLFKTLDGTTSPIARYKYPVGRWTRHLNPAMLDPGHVGYHLAEGPRVLRYLSSALYAAEPCPNHGVLESGGQLLTCRVRLTGVKAWNRRSAHLFAADCTEATLLSEQACGREPDERSWATVESARAYANGLIGGDELAAARGAAEDAARTAVEGAAGSAVVIAAWTAIRLASADARSAAWFTVRTATEAVSENAAWGFGAQAIAESALFDRLLMYLNGAELPPVEPLYGPAMEGSTR